MSRRGVVWGGALAATGVGYYLYQAGGSPKEAKSDAQHDAERLKAKLSGEAEHVPKEGERLAEQAGKKLDSTVDQARAKRAEAESSLSQIGKDASTKFDNARKDAGRKIDEVDVKVEKKAAEAKSGISSWLGFGGK